MTDDDKYKVAFTEAVASAIRSMGLRAFRKTSFFMSNHRKPKEG